MRPADFAKRSVVITGASSGIGAAFARALAARGAHLALVARRRERLEALAAELTAAGHPTPAVIVADLCRPEAAERVVVEATRQFGPIEVLINNAGLGYAGAFPELAAAQVQEMIDLNISAVTRLTHLVVPAMIQRRSGWIMNVASVVGHVPFACMPVYAPTKAFVVAFSNALWAQLRRHHVHVTCVAPGTTRTEFFDHRTWTGLRRQLMRLSMSADDVARIALRALARGRRSVICGNLNRLFVALMKPVPQRFIALVSERTSA
ncbi:MAG TPA: SDR family NAD(P)-dependent oxidoreductase [Phycisphaerae bacterium]|nr:SDR family NAD(P)-dependent oxidoreductase [Phycisphaerae bacterium]HNU47125.1 SDR family NAD(P)-dependent oxidoreductase [Phycisphaerae bacterium]